jgi:alpha-tubulin suppressor-like RCC1 family protein
MNIKNMYCGDCHTFVILENGKIFGFGKNTSGQLGLNERYNRNEPTEIKSLENLEIVDFFCGNVHTIAISSLFYYK